MRAPPSLASRTASRHRLVLPMPGVADEDDAREAGARSLDGPLDGVELAAAADQVRPCVRLLRTPERGHRRTVRRPPDLARSPVGGRIIVGPGRPHR